MLKVQDQLTETNGSGHGLAAHRKIACPCGDGTFSLCSECLAPAVHAHDSTSSLSARGCSSVIYKKMIYIRTNAEPNNKKQTLSESVFGKSSWVPIQGWEVGKCRERRLEECKRGKEWEEAVTTGTCDTEKITILDFLLNHCCPHHDDSGSCRSPAMC